VALLYRALAIGAMGVIAPTTAVLAVAIPVVASMLMGQRTGARALAGIALALVAIVLVSQSGGSEAARRSPGSRLLPAGVGLALLSGVAIGLFFLSLAQTAAGAGMWPLVSARVVSVTLFAGMAVWGARQLRLSPPLLTMVVCGGALDMLANALYLVASRSGPLSTVVTLSSLYPASTVALARIVLGERLNGWQMTGIGCALGAIVLIVGTG
jgi:drug/metabolite transporter (DMT)-like permease